MSPKVSDPQMIAAMSRVPAKVLQSMIVSSLLISTFTLFSMTLVYSIRSDLRGIINLKIQDYLSLRITLHGPCLIRIHLRYNCG